MGRCGSWQSLTTVLLAITLSLSAAAKCDGICGPCSGRVEGSDTDCSTLPGIPLVSLSLRGGADCETVKIARPNLERNAKSGLGGRTVTMRRLGKLGSASGVRLSMMHRSSHPSVAKLHPSEALHQSLLRDQARVSRFAKQVTFASTATSRSQARAYFPDLTQPGGKKTTESTNSSSNDGLSKFESTVGSGVSLGSGEYFMDLYLGTPAKYISVIIDTGSDLTWVQCDPCDLCYHQEGPTFDPKLSSTYESLPCNSENCVSAGGFGEDPEGCSDEKPGLCKYFYRYGDLSNTTGDFSLETVTFNASRGDPLRIEKILFGCGHSNIGLFQGAGGLLGLGQGSISFVSQVGALFGNKFSYCLVDRDDPDTMRSPLIFGEDLEYAKLEDKMQWTPFLKDAPIDTFYYVNITGVSVGGEVMPIPESAWAIDPEGYGGTIIDSGTTLSYFKQESYDLISAAFQKSISYPKVTTVPVLDVCYNITGVESPDFPSFSIAFHGNAVMELALKNYFIRADPEDDIYCLALLPVPSKNMNIIGNFQQQNFHVVYDRGNSRLGFAPVDCTGKL